MNNLSLKKEIVNAFGEDDYKILIVANKFQTGFDKPLLHTMYIDKQLNGIAAVQTLSRANRIYPHKNDTLILDFVNKPDVIQKSFQPYYESTYLEEGTDPHKLYDLYDALLDFQIFDGNDINNFVDNYKKGAIQPRLHNILNPIVGEFKKLDKDKRGSFKKILRRYQNIYSFLSQLIPFFDVKLEKLYIFGKFLLRKLPAENDTIPYNVLEDVDIDSYKIENKGKKEIELTGYGELKPNSDVGGEPTPPYNEALSVIIKELNDAFGTDFTDDDKLFLAGIKNHLMGNEDLKNKIKSNSKRKVKVVFDSYFNEEMKTLLNNNIEFYKRIVDNEKLKTQLKSLLFDSIYNAFIKEIKKES